MKITGDINKIPGQDNVSDLKKRREIKGEKFDEVLNKKNLQDTAKPTDSGSVNKMVDKPVDAARFSSEAEKIRFVNEVVAKTPDIRQEKVDSIKAKIQNGQYDVSAEQLAQKLIDDGIAEKLLEG
jgi:negative regulator of flagellin synthesis FlgM